MSFTNPRCPRWRLYSKWSLINWTASFVKGRTISFIMLWIMQCCEQTPVHMDSARASRRVQGRHGEGECALFGSMDMDYLAHLQEGYQQCRGRRWRSCPSGHSRCFAWWSRFHCARFGGASVPSQAAVFDARLASVPVDVRSRHHLSQPTICHQGLFMMTKDCHYNPFIIMMMIIVDLASQTSCQKHVRASSGTVRTAPLGRLCPGLRVFTLVPGSFPTTLCWLYKLFVNSHRCRENRAIQLDFLAPRASKHVEAFSDAGRWESQRGMAQKSD